MTAPPDAARIVADARAREREETSGRLPLPEYATWATFPFDGEISVKAVADVELPEPPRSGAGGVDCWACGKADEDYLWSDGEWRVGALREPSGLPVVLLLEPRAHHDLDDLPPHLVASLGPAIARVNSALLSLGGIIRVQLARFGDGAEHLHLWFLPRPDGLVQARGSFLAMWDDILPPRPRDEWEATLERLRSALAAA